MTRSPPHRRAGRSAVGSLVALTALLFLGALLSSTAIKPVPQPKPPSPACPTPAAPPAATPLSCPPPPTAISNAVMERLNGYVRAHTTYRALTYPPVQIVEWGDLQKYRQIRDAPVAGVFDTGTRTIKLSITYLV